MAQGSGSLRRSSFACVVSSCVTVGKSRFLVEPQFSRLYVKLEY